MRLRFLAALAVLVASPSFPATPDEAAAIATVQKLFDAMARHDSEGALAVLMPEGRIVAIRADGTTSGGTQDEFAARLSAMKEPILERMWNPAALVQGRIAHVWTEYDFWRSGKFGHCGIDSVSLVKTQDGWKIAGISYTTQTTGCAPSPLGPPAAQ